METKIVKGITIKRGQMLVIVYESGCNNFTYEELTDKRIREIECDYFIEALKVV